MGMIKIPENSIKKFKNNFDEIIQSGNLAEGNWNKKLGAFFNQYTGAKNSIPFSSNGSGLLAILILLKKYKAYENIFIQSNTMYGVKTIAITSGLNYIGAVDCDFLSLMPNASQVEDYLKSIKNPEKTVFLISHIGGIVNPDIVPISKLCHSYGVALIEDCAHSLGATLDGKHSGLFGLAGVYSLYATKAVPAGEGGIAITNDEQLSKMLNKFNIYDRFDQEQEVGVNFRISEMQALFSLCICEETENIIKNKEKIANKYIENCQNAGIDFISQNSNGQRGNYYKFILLSKNTVEKDFKKITLRTSSVYDYAIGNDKNSIISKHLCIPIWYNLENDVIQQVVTTLSEVN